MVASVEADAEGSGEMDATQERGFVVGGLGIEPGLVDGLGRMDGVDAEIAHTEGGQILEEMSALAGVDTEGADGAFHNDARHADMGPFDGDAQAGV